MKMSKIARRDLFIVPVYVTANTRDNVNCNFSLSNMEYSLLKHDLDDITKLPWNDDQFFRLAIAARWSAKILGTICY
jgi:hypothetical protein